MTDEKILCFTLNGHLLGVENSQIEKVLINKHPSRSSFTLETGVEVKRLQEYLPLPGGEAGRAENILFVRDQKDYYGFSVDRVQGYLKLRGGSAVHMRAGERGAGEGSEPIKYFVRSQDRYIPVMDLRGITNSNQPVSDQIIQEIASFSPPEEAPEAVEEVEALRISEEEVYRSIEEEINRAKGSGSLEETIVSEKRGAVMPLVVNIAIVVVFGAGLLFYLALARERAQEQALSSTVSGVEEEVIREIRRRSRQEVAEQKQKLEAARERLSSLEQERELFLKNQDRLLQERERRLQEEFQRKLQEARERIAAGGGDFEEEFARERQRLMQEYDRSRGQLQEEMERIRREYEQELAEQQAQISREMQQYNARIGEIERQLREERARLEEAETRMQTVLGRQEEYRAFRAQLNELYTAALDELGRENYDQGIRLLRNIPPVIDRAARDGVAGSEELDVEQRLVAGLLALASSQKERVDLGQVARRTYQAAAELESLGNLDEALSRYYTAYTIAPDRSLQDRALDRARSVLDRLYSDRSEARIADMNRRASDLLSRALRLKEDREYGRALEALESILTGYPGTEVAGRAVRERDLVQSLIEQREEAARRERLNQEASRVMDQAREAARRGFHQEALEKYETVVSAYRGSDYVDGAVSEIIRLNRTLREDAAGSLIVTADQSRVGVIIRLSADGSLLFNLGSRDGLQEGEVLGIYRREGEELGFIGNLRVTEVFPTISRAAVLFSDRELRIGDVVSSS
ncbi:MAG: hypothetical protein ACOC8N_02920 [Spirochaetota bacterium]